MQGTFLLSCQPKGSDRQYWSLFNKGVARIRCLLRFLGSTPWVLAIHYCVRLDNVDWDIVSPDSRCKAQGWKMPFVIGTADPMQHSERCANMPQFWGHAQFDANPVMTIKRMSHDLVCRMFCTEHPCRMPWCQVCYKGNADEGNNVGKPSKPQAWMIRVASWGWDLNGYLLMAVPMMFKGSAMTSVKSFAVKRIGISRFEPQAHILAGLNITSPCQPTFSTFRAALLLPCTGLRVREQATIKIFNLLYVGVITYHLSMMYVYCHIWLGFHECLLEMLPSGMVDVSMLQKVP